MQEWTPVTKGLPGRGKHVYAKDSQGRIFRAVYLGPSTGWVNAETLEVAKVTHWTGAV